jgi:septal ring factor EnvC (AmiA/AmiB activator)
MRRGLFVFLLFWGAFSGGLQAQSKNQPKDPRQVEARLTEIRFQVDSGESEIAHLKTQFNELIKERKSIERALQKVKEDEQKLLQRVNTLTLARTNLTKSLGDAQQEMERHTEALRARLRALYKASMSSMTGQLVWRGTGPEVERVALYAKSLKRHDDELFRSVRVSVDRVVAKRRELDGAVLKEGEAQAALTASRRDGESQLAKLKALGDQLAAKKKAAEKELNKLRAEADRLELFIAALTRGEIQAEVQPTETPASAPTVSVDAKEESATSRVVAPEPPPVPLRGLFARGVKASAPLVGRVIQPFGKVRVASFADMIFSKGLEFTSTPGIDVLAVAVGKVAFAGTMPGYDTVVVLDHGERSYSLYGRLGQSLVKVGEFVQQKQRVGTTGELDDKGRNFYFEVRKNGAPVNPATVVKAQ